MLKLVKFTYRLGLRAEINYIMYRAEYFVNGIKVTLTFLKSENYHPIIFKKFKELFNELKCYLFIPGSSVSTSFRLSNSREVFTIKVYYKKGMFLC